MKVKPVPISFLYILTMYIFMNNLQLEQLKKQYILMKILGSYFDEQTRKELEALRHKINEMQDQIG